MREPREPIFLERHTYRRRRLIDAARIVPVLGGVLFLAPVLNLSAGSGSTVAGSGYLFGVWALLIVLSFVLTRRIARTNAEAEREAPPGEDEVARR